MSKKSGSDEESVKAAAGGFNFDNSYTRLPASFYVRLNPVPVPSPGMVLFNASLAEYLGLDAELLDGDLGASVFSGNLIPENSEPIAMSYAGHQFGHFTVLGDGRAILLGEQITPEGKRFDIQLKGSGQTPFSRRGDGRAALGPMLREFIISEAMHALEVPTTRSLAAVATGEEVLRQDVLTGAILTRVASSHIRVGTFEYASVRGNISELRALADYTIWRHYPELKSSANPYLFLLDEVMKKQAMLVAEWQNVGFIHGVMNTDNMAVSGETIDYGPCAFMDSYDPATVFSSIDHHGRYSYANQPVICQWNLARFAETLLPLISEDQQKAIGLAKEILESFPEIFEQYWLSGMRAKLGLFNEESADLSLANSLLTCMHDSQGDFTNTFRSLALDSLPDEPLFKQATFEKWHERWVGRLSRQTRSREEARQLMLKRNPAFIPRNHRVEESLEVAEKNGDLSAIKNLLNVLSRPFDHQPENAEYQRPPDPSNKVYQTFCGT